MALLCALAPWREMGFLVQAAVLAKAQRRKGRKGEPSAMAPLNFQRSLVGATTRKSDGRIGKRV
jgi:hypothetical protein